MGVTEQTALGSAQSSCREWRGRQGTLGTVHGADTARIWHSSCWVSVIWALCLLDAIPTFSLLYCLLCLFTGRIYF